MVESKEEVKIDTNLYSRQIGTFGLETMGKLVKMNVLIVGQRGLGVEIAKNLILAGPASVDLYDPTKVAIGDLSSNFYIKEEDVGKKTRAEATVGQLSELNQYVKVNVATKLSIEDHKKYSLVCYTENFDDINNLIAVNEFCRKNGVGFILSETLGAAGYAFLDFGDKHMVSDANGEQTKSFIISNISQDEQGLLTVHEDKRHSFEDGDYVKIVEVEGMTELNNREPIKITTVTPYSFKLHIDTREFGAYVRQGTVENIKVPKAVSFHSLGKSVEVPAANDEMGFLQSPDQSKWGRADQSHLAVRAIHKFQVHNGRYPENNEDEVQQVLKYAQEINKLSKEAEKHNVDEIDEDFIKTAARFATCSITAQSAFFGGAIAQEIVKFTGKYSPLKQWLHYDIFETIPTGDVNREPMNSRYDDQIKIYGRELQEKLGKVNTFLVGAGALGCEYIKAFALMGLGCAEGGNVSCTDNDNIEVSNLNRQFLFRQ